MLLLNFSDVSKCNLEITEIKGLVYASRRDMELAVDEMEKWAERKDADGIINIKVSITESVMVDDSSIAGKEYSIIRTFTVIGTAVKFNKI